MTKTEVAFLEIAALLHDLGKLSRAWLDYRRLYQETDKTKNPFGYNWNNDPHDNNFLEGRDGQGRRYDEQIDNFKALPKIFRKNYYTDKVKYESHSIAKVINEHTGSTTSTLITLFQIADSLDSQYDRNNPLLCREQKTSHTFDTELYGQEKQDGVPWNEPDQGALSGIYLEGAPPAPHKTSTEEMEEVRRWLYSYLENNLDSYLENPDAGKRREILGAIRAAFDRGLSDTCRPQNDTTLWEHCYSVMALFKAGLYGFGQTEAWSRDNFRFRLLGIGWNGISFLASARRLGDTLGRARLLGDIRRKVRDSVEFGDFFHGSQVFWDINHMVFILPGDLPDDDVNELKQSVRKDIFDASNGDIMPTFSDITGVRSLTSIVRVLDDLKKQCCFPANGLNEKERELLEKPWRKVTRRETCPVCRRRPIIGEKEDKNQITLCRVCLERRKKLKDVRANDPKSALFTHEIESGKEGAKAALLIFHFGLRYWLSGRMQRSLFITEVDGIKKEIEALEDISKIVGIPEWRANIAENRKTTQYPAPDSYNYKVILEDMKSVFRDGNVSFLYGSPDNLRTALDDFKGYYNESSSIEDNSLLAAAACTKTPTPSTLLDSWESPFQFLVDLAGDRLGAIENRRRYLLDLEQETNELDYLWTSVTAEAQIKGKLETMELAFIENHKAIILSSSIKAEEIPDDFSFRVIKVEGKQADKKEWKCRKKDSEDYSPMRAVALAPNLAVFLVPGEGAIAAAKHALDKYGARFGKVRGRLPFDIGVLFFNPMMAMHLVLDAAQRMIDGFEKKDCEKQVEKVTVHSFENTGSKADQSKELSLILNERGLRDVKFQIPLGLGDGETDRHHPYMYLSKVKADTADSKKSYFKTAGWDENNLEQVAHVSEIFEGDELRINPGAFDFEHLDSVERRYEIRYKQLRPGDLSLRRSIPYKFKNKPYILEELDRFEEWWTKISTPDENYFPGLTNTKLRALEDLWVSKLFEWEVDLSNTGSEAFKLWEALVDASIEKSFKNAARKEAVKEAVKSGLLLDVLELYNHILKQGVKERS